MRGARNREILAAGRTLAVLLALSACLGAAGLLVGCGTPVDAPTASRAFPPATLGETGLYADVATRRIASDVLPFSPQYPLWTDGAAKARWIRLPPGTWIDATNPESWDFPVGTQLWKEFAWERRVETRYIERTSDGWRFAAYLWTEDGRDAVLAPQDGVRGAYEFAPGLKHDVPGRSDCRVCHETRPTPVLGFTALQLSPDRDPLAPHAEAPDPDDVDLTGLVRRNLIRGLPASLEEKAPRIEAPTPRARAALGYLHANCGTCHAETSPIASLGLTLESRLGALGATPPAVATTVGRESKFRVPAERGVAATRVVPGSPGESVLFLRLTSRNPLRQMPPLGSHAVDPEGAALVEAWIREDLGTSACPTCPTVATSTDVKESHR